MSKVNPIRAERVLQRICTRIGEKYSGTYKVSVGLIGIERCTKIHFSGRMQQYDVLIGSRYTRVFDSSETELATYDDITEDDLQGGNIIQDVSAWFQGLLGAGK